MQLKQELAGQRVLVAFIHSLWSSTRKDGMKSATQTAVCKSPFGSQVMKYLCHWQTEHILL